MKPESRVAFSAIRWSSHSQDDKTSEERQVTGTEQYAKEMGWEWRQDLCVVDKARSGYHGEQRELKAMALRAERGELPENGVVVVEAINRMGREGIDPTYQLIRQILLSGCWLAVSSKKKYFTADSLNQPMEIMELLWEAYLAWKQSDEKSDYTRKAWGLKRKNETAFTQKVPAWIVRCDRDGNPVRGKANDGDHYRADDKKAAVIKKIFQWTIDGFGSRQVIQKLDRAGIKSIATGFSKAARGKWNQSYIKGILDNRAVLGECQEYTMKKKKRIRKGKPIPDRYPQIIDEATFEAAHAAIKSRYQQRGPAGKGIANLFQAMLHDPVTKTNYRLIQGTAQDKKRGCTRRIAPYACVNQGLPHETWQYEQFEILFLSCLYFVKAPTKDKGNPIPALESSLKECLANIETVTARIGKNPDFAAGLRLLENLDSQRQQLERQVQEVKQQRQADKLGSHDNYCSLLEALRDCPASELVSMRAKIKGVLRLLVEGATVKISTIKGNRLRKRLECLIKMKDGRQTGFTVETWKGRIENSELLFLGEKGKTMKLYNDKTGSQLSLKSALGELLVTVV